MAFAVGYLDGDDFGVEYPFAPGFGAARVALDGKGVLFLPRDAVGLGAGFPAQAHVFIGKGIGQSVVQHAVHQGNVAEFLPVASRGQVVRHPGHAFHPAGNDDVVVAYLDALGAQHDGLQSRSADFVDRGGGNAVRDTGLQGGLFGRGLSQTGLENAAHVNFVDFIFFYGRAAFHCTFDGDGAQLGGRNVFQPAAKTADGSACCRYDDCVPFFHVFLWCFSGSFSGFEGAI